MKKILSATLALAMTLSLLPAAFAAGGTAYASTQAVEVDGKKVEFQMYALKDNAGNPTNYVKLRDVAHVLNGTKAQFSEYVLWGMTALSPSPPASLTPTPAGR